MKTIFKLFGSHLNSWDLKDMIAFKPLKKITISISVTLIPFQWKMQLNQSQSRWNIMAHEQNAFVPTQSGCKIPN